MPAWTKGPWLHRAGVALLGVVIAVLTYWLLDFAVGDLGSLPGPEWERYERAHLDPSLLLQQEALASQAREATAQIERQRERQELLARSTENSRQTMNQLLEVQRLGLQKGVKPSAAEQAALAESQQLFLANQRRFQVLNEDIARLAEQQREAGRRQAEQERVLQERRRPLREAFAADVRRHELKLAALQLLVLLPLLGLAVYLFLRRRGGLLAPLVWAYGIPVTWKVAEVVHEHFPSRFFKYVALAAVLAVAVRLLVQLLRNAAAPGREWLLRRYREAYEQLRCPGCDYPIRRGPFQFLLRTRRGVLAPPPEGGRAAGPYTCPACGLRLYEACTACLAVRPSLLPWCDSCGAAGQPAQPTPAGPGAA